MVPIFGSIVSDCLVECWASERAVCAAVTCLMLVRDSRSRSESSLRGDIDVYTRIYHRRPQRLYASV